MPKRYKIALCRFPGGGIESHQCVTWLLKTIQRIKNDPNVEAVKLITVSDTPITMSRNRAVKEALESGCDYILMIDSDLSPDNLLGVEPTAAPFWETAWKFLLDQRSAEDKIMDGHKALLAEIKDIEHDDSPWASDHAAKLHARADELLDSVPGPATIAAPYCGPPPHECVYVCKWKNMQSTTPEINYKLELFEREDAAARSGIEEAGALPTGLILYDSRVFRNLPMPWFEYEYNEPEQATKATTEDIYQTRNASFLGMKQYVAWDCWAGHMKTKEVVKPASINADSVHASLVEAVKRGRKAGERVKWFRGFDASAQQPK